MPFIREATTTAPMKPTQRASWLTNRYQGSLPSNWPCVATAKAMATRCADEPDTGTDRGHAAPLDPWTLGTKGGVRDVCVGHASP